jgi:hypothetical protein
MQPNPALDDTLINTGTPVLDADSAGNGKTLTVNGTGSLTVNPARTLTAKKRHLIMVDQLLSN